MATNPPAPAPRSGISDFLFHTNIGPFPVVVWIVAGGAVLAFFVLPKVFPGLFGGGTTSQTASNTGTPSADTSGQALQGYANTLSQAGIDPLTGVPFSIEGATNPNTGLPNYYNSSTGTTPPTTGTPTQTPTGPTPTPPTPPVTDQTVSPATPATPAPAIPSTLGGQPAANNALSYSSNVNAQFNQAGEVVPSGGKYYVATGNPNIHLWNIATQEYGVSGSAINTATQGIINANPGLAGQSFTYVPPAGTRILIPQQ